MKYVSMIQGGTVQTSEPGATGHAYLNDAELVHIVRRLIDSGFAFVDEPAGWPPAEVLRQLQARCLLRQSFTAITWTAPGKYRSYEVRPC